ncbi:MAG TPA: hypothetical protein DEF45_10895 [Rhodopirellula sp.]|nr:hypothetical protein [Rhodopirellula sp.]
MNDVLPRINDAYRQMKQHLEGGILPFWMENGLDREHEGYLTCFDAEGRTTDNTDKYLVTQTRMIWGMSAAFFMYPQKHEFQKAARQGVEFLLNHFWDEEHGGWFWKVRRDGGLIDGAKLVYGQSFAIYTLSQYTLSTGDARGLDYAQRTFDRLQLYCADTYRGGYHENLEADWSVCAPGFPGGDRKSLDILELCYKVATLLVAPLFLLFFMAIFVPWSTPFGTHVGTVFSVLVAVGVAYFNILGLTFQWMMPASFVAGAIVGGLVSLTPIGPRSKSRTEVSEKKP